MPPPPPPSEKAPTYDKDRTLTRRSVAGAAGGMKGVDYEDDRRPEPGQEASRAGPSASELRAGERAGAPLGAALTDDKQGLAQPDASKILQEHDGPAPLHTRRRRRFVARDRLTIDKDAPELKRRRKNPDDDDDDESSDERSAEQTLEFFPDAVGAAGLAPSVSRAQLFSAETRPEPGDLSLTDPDTIQRALETPLAYAKHAMILAEAFRRSTGASRHEAIDYLARLFVAPRDRTFGRSALKEFGPSSGILDVYPLEVVTHVLDHYPQFLPKVSRGQFFHRSGERAATWRTDTQTPVILEYAEDLKVRAFALVGGGTPGYVFEPADAPGRYSLTVRSPGRWTCSVSGVSRTGHTTVDTFVVQVTLAPGDVVLPALGEPYPARDAARVAAWPVPSVPAVLDAEPAEPVRATDEARLSTGELLHQRARDDERRLRDIDLEVSEADAPIADRTPAGIPEAETIRERPPRAPAPAARASTPAARSLPRALPPKASTDGAGRSLRTPSASRVPEASTEPGAPRAALRVGPRVEEAPTTPTRLPTEPAAPPTSDETADLPAIAATPAPEAESPATAVLEPRADSRRGTSQAEASPRARPDGATSRGSAPSPRPVREGEDTSPRLDGGAAPRPRVPAATTGARALSPRSPLPASSTTISSSPPARRAPEPPRPAATDPRAIARPKPRPRARPDEPSAAEAPRLERTELSGAIADAFARLAATPLSAPPPVRAEPSTARRLEPSTAPRGDLPTSPHAEPSAPRVEPSPTPHSKAASDDGGSAARAHPTITGVRPTAPLFDDTDTPADLDELSGEPVELDPAWVMEVNAPPPAPTPHEPPTSRIPIHPELAADLMLDAEVPRTAATTAHPAPRVIRRNSSVVDPGSREPGE